MSIFGGASRVDISPPKGTSMVGYFNVRRSEGVHDPIFSNALVFSYGKEKIAIVSVDLCVIKLVTTQKIRKIVERKTGIPGDNILIHCTHIHTGPATVPNIYNIPYEKEWVEGPLVEKIARSIELANSRLKEVRIGFGNGKEDSIAFNRRYWLKEGIVRTNPGILNPNIVKPAGPIDPQVGVLKVEDLNGKLKALVIHYTCHSDTVGGKLISADYFGYARKIIRDVLGEGVEIICLNGACGDINHVNVRKALLPERQHYHAHTDYMGTLLGAEVLKVMEKIKVSDEQECIIDAKSKAIKLKHRKIPVRAVEQARRIVSAAPEEMEKICEKEIPIMEMKSDPLVVKTYAQSILRFSALKNKWEDTEIQAIRIGNIAIVGVPCEFFVELGLEIKNKSPFKPFTFIAELANDWVGYIPTKKAFSEGGYETIFGDASWVEENAGDKIVDLSLKILNCLFSAKSA